MKKIVTFAVALSVALCGVAEANWVPDMPWATLPFAKSCDEAAVDSAVLPQNPMMQKPIPPDATCKRAWVWGGGGMATSPTITNNWTYKGGELEAWSPTTPAGAGAGASTTFKAKLSIAGGTTSWTQEVMPVKSITSSVGNGNGLHKLPIPLSNMTQQEFYPFRDNRFEAIVEFESVNKVYWTVAGRAKAPKSTLTCTSLTCTP